MTTYHRSPKSGLWLPVEPLPVPEKLVSAQNVLAAESIRTIFDSHDVPLSAQSGLGKLLLAAEASSQYRPDSIVSTRQIFDAIQVFEIQRSLAVIEGHPKAKEFLWRLLKGTLSSYDFGPSPAKDALWELEVCAKMRWAGLAAELSEPDVLWKNESGSTGIACKKIYSQRKVSSAISKAIAQIKAAGGYGFVAINIDELLPRHRTLSVPNWEAADIRPQEMITHFLAKHRGRFEKYFGENRVSAFIVGLTCRTGVHHANGRRGYFFNVQWRALSAPELEEGHRQRAKELAEALNRLTMGKQ